MYRLSNSWPPQVFTPEVRLPGKWVRCPLCGRHYIVKDRAHPNLCAMVDDD